MRILFLWAFLLISSVAFSQTFTGFGSPEGCRFNKIDWTVNADITLAEAEAGGTAKVIFTAKLSVPNDAVYVQEGKNFSLTDAGLNAWPQPAAVPVGMKIDYDLFYNGSLVKSFRNVYLGTYPIIRFNNKDLNGKEDSKNGFLAGGQKIYYKDFKLSDIAVKVNRAEFSCPPANKELNDKITKLAVEQKTANNAPAKKEIIEEKKPETLSDTTTQTKEVFKGCPDEKDAAFPGGIDAWKQFIQKNVDFEVPLENRAPKGTYRAEASFQILKDGSVEVLSISGLGTDDYGIYREIRRVLNKSPKWDPALQCGPKIYKTKQPFTFVVDYGDDDDAKTKAKPKTETKKETKQDAPVTKPQETKPEIKAEDGKPCPDEKEASFPGGPEAWREFISKNIDITVPSENKAPAGIYRAEAHFQVLQDGRIGAIEVTGLLGGDYGIYNEVKRLLKRSPKWNPAMQCGPKIFTYKQIFTFQVSQ